VKWLPALLLPVSSPAPSVEPPFGPWETAGVRLQIAGESGAVVGRVERAIAKAPGRVEAYKGVGVTWYARGDLEEDLEPLRDGPELLQIAALMSERSAP
jgi:hypothetical protein